MGTLFLFFICLLSLSSEGASEGFECDDKPSILCLAPGYSTFDLPFRHQQNFIKIVFDISDVLSINDKDFSITFGLYFSVEWVEPRLNLSQDVWGAGSKVGDTLVPVNL